MKTKSIKYIVISDIHLGHDNNKTENIIKHLKLFFLDNHKLIKTVDCIFLAGDVFDKLLTSYSNEFALALEWLSELVLYCSSNNIKLRILEGTPSHDWKQTNVFMKTLNKLNVNVDFKYIDTLYIETFTEHNINVLYVPDEYKHNAEETLIDVKKLLKEKELSSVDIAIMHGQFNYQLPMVKSVASHDEEEYLNIVDDYISIGHIHTASVFGRILAQGSIDRLTHGQEEDKGCMYIKIQNEHKEYKFIKNPYAMLFKTFRYDYLTIEEIVASLDEELKKLPLGTFVRCIVTDDTMLVKSKKTIKERYPGYKVDVESNKTNKLKNDLLTVNDSVELETFSITESNIKDLLFKELDKHSLTPQELAVAEKEFLTIFNSV